MSVAGAAILATNGPGSPLRWLFFVAVSTTAMVLVFWLAHVTVLRRRATRPVAVWVVVAVGALAGLARALAIIGGQDVIDERLLRPWPSIVALSVLIVTTGTVGFAVVFDHIAEQRARRARLRVRLATLREQELDRSGLTDAITHAAYQEMVAALDDARAGLARPLGTETADDRNAVAASLRATVDQTLRPLSHTLYATARRAAEEEAAPGRTWTTWRSLPVRPLPTALVIGLLAMVVTANLVGPLILAVAIWLLLEGVVQAARRWTWFGTWSFPIAAVATGLLSGVAAAVVRAVADTGTTGSGVALGAVVGLPMVVAMVSATAAVLQGEGAATERLLHQVNDREIDALVANREIARATRALAEHVHGALQSRLLATAFAIDASATSADDAAFRDALASARAALESAGHRAQPERGDLVAALDQAGALWTGFIDVTVRVDPGVPPLAPHVIEDAVRVAEEAIANAHKHGEATGVDIAVAPVAGTLRVVATDNGHGPVPGIPGLGSAWLDFIAPGGWSLGARPDGAGAVLTVDLPMGDRSAAR